MQFAFERLQRSHKSVYQGLNVLSAFGILQTIGVRTHQLRALCVRKSDSNVRFFATEDERLTCDRTLKRLHLMQNVVLRTLGDKGLCLTRLACELYLKATYEVRG